MNDTWASAEIPAWFGGGNFREYARSAGLLVRQNGIGKRRWSIQTVENFAKRRPGLVTMDTLEEHGKPDRWSQLGTLPVRRSAATSSFSREDHLSILNAIKTKDDASLLEIATLVRNLVSLVPVGNFESSAKAGFEALSRLAAKGSSGVDVSKLAARFVQFSPFITERLALARALVRVEVEPDLMERKPTVTPGDSVFGSAWYLGPDVQLARDVYMSPLYLAAAPNIWCFRCYRTEGVLIYDFGGFISGGSPGLSELSHLFNPMATNLPKPLNVSGKQDFAGASTWWVSRVDDLLCVLTDFSTYCDASDSLIARSMFEAFLGIEHLGRRVHGILLQDRDFGNRLALAYDAIDILDGLGIVKAELAMTWSHAKKTYDRLSGSLPPAAIDLFLPAAKSAVDALQSMQSGFFMKSMLRPGGISLPDGSGNDRLWTLEDAVAAYLRQLRNANHGYEPKRDANLKRNEMLLTVHTGKLDQGLVYLPYLYWLDTIAHPDRLRSIFRSRARARR